MLAKPQEDTVRSLLLLKHPEFVGFINWIRASYQLTLERLAEAEIGTPAAKLQGEAKQLKDLLTHIDGAREIAHRMNQK